MMRATIKKLPFAHSAIRAVRAMRRAIPRRPRPLILMYHRIARDSFDPWGLAVEPDRFAEHLRWLSDNRIVLPLDEFAAKHGEGTLPARAAAITFDDGYACAAEIAAPLLERYRLPATIFLPAEIIERGELFWWDELESLVVGTDNEKLRLSGKDIRLGERSPKDSLWAPGAPPRTPRQSAFFAIWSRLRKAAPAVVEQLLAELRAQAGSQQGARSKRLLYPREVRTTAASGLVDFGSHALTHPSLPALTAAEKKRQIEGSVERCAALSGRRPLTFAYPFGDYDEDCERMVEQAGFVCACTTEQRAVRQGSSAYELPRIAMENWDTRTLADALGA